MRMINILFYLLCRYRKVSQIYRMNLQIFILRVLNFTNLYILKADHYESGNFMHIARIDSHLNKHMNKYVRDI